MDFLRSYCIISLFRLLYLSTSIVQRLEIFRVQNLEISTLLGNKFEPYVPIPIKAEANFVKVFFYSTKKSELASMNLKTFSGMVMV